MGGRSGERGLVVKDRWVVVVVGVSSTRGHRAAVEWKGVLRRRLGLGDGHGDCNGRIVRKVGDNRPHVVLLERIQLYLGSHWWLELDWYARSGRRKEIEYELRREEQVLASGVLRVLRALRALRAGTIAGVEIGREIGMGLVHFVVR